MKRNITKRPAVLALCFLVFGAASAQGLWSGVATYSNWMVGGGSASTYTSYYRGMDVMTDMPQSKTKTLFLDKCHRRINVKNIFMYSLEYFYTFAKYT